MKHDDIELQFFKNIIMLQNIKFVYNNILKDKRFTIRTYMDSLELCS